MMQSIPVGYGTMTRSPTEEFRQADRIFIHPIPRSPLYPWITSPKTIQDQGLALNLPTGRPDRSHGPRCHGRSNCFI
jgi:cation transport regulator ChaC